MKKYRIEYKMDELPRKGWISASSPKAAINKATKILAEKYGSYPLSISAEEIKEEKK